MSVNNRNSFKNRFFNLRKTDKETERLLSKIIQNASENGKLCPPKLTVICMLKSMKQ